VDGRRLIGALPRTTRHAGYGITQRIRKRVEEIFGWTATAIDSVLPILYTNPPLSKQPVLMSSDVESYTRTNTDQPTHDVSGRISPTAAFLARS
jgi:hypothetical protein